MLYSAVAVLLYSAVAVILLLLLACNIGVLRKSIRFLCDAFAILGGCFWVLRAAVFKLSVVINDVDCCKAKKYHLVVVLDNSFVDGNRQFAESRQPPR